MGGAGSQLKNGEQADTYQGYLVGMENVPQNDLERLRLLRHLSVAEFILFGCIQRTAYE